MIRVVNRRTMLPFAAGVLAIVAFHTTGGVYVDGFFLDLGSLNFPTARYVVFVALWMFLGGIAAACVAVALARCFETPEDIGRVRREIEGLSERRFLAWTCVAAFLIPVILRVWLLQGAPLADDESAYRFAAQLIASGRLWVPSPVMKLFFDQNFMINDGRLYPVYFLGWPALLSIGVLLHLPQFVNPILSALTVPALFGSLKHFTGRLWARAGIFVFLSAPMLQIAAATGLAHTSCLAMLAWALFFLVRIEERGGSILDHAGFGSALGLGFCIRPPSTVALGVPLLVAWALAIRRAPRADRLRRAVAFCVPAAVLAVLFLGTLWLQNGSPFRVGYARYNAYIVQNGFRFTSFAPSDLTRVAGFDFSGVSDALANTAAAMFRLNFDLFGWPSSFALLVLGLPAVSRNTRLLWAMIGTYLLFSFFQRDWGIDTFGPLHAFELSLPVLLLTIRAARDLSSRLTVHDPEGRAASPEWQMVPASLVVSCVLCAWSGFVPVRLSAVEQIARHLNIALRAPEREHLHHAIVFAPWPFAEPCDSPNHFVLFRPTNDPDLRDDVLWVNHLDLASDRRLAESMPGRTGYLMRWTKQCDVVLQPLSQLRPADVPPGRIRF